MSRLHELIPGGCHTYSKGDVNFPPNAPKRLFRGKGGTVHDAAGRPFVDWGMGINNVLVGHSEDFIDGWAIGALMNGQAFCRPSVLEEDAAETVLRQFPHAEMIKFCKSGSDANNAAIRLARAVTGRQHIAFDGTAPFFSTADWFCGQMPRYAGTLDAERAFAHTFTFNDVDSLERVFATRPLACVILELCRMERPTPVFLEALRHLCSRRGTLLIVDEVVTGYRYAAHGVAPLFSIKPDLFTIGKGLGNGYAVAALLGKRQYMKRGAEDVFLLSTTNGAEQSGLAAAIATTQLYQQHDVIGELARQGRELCDIVDSAVAAIGWNESLIRTDFDCRPFLRLPPAIKETFHSALIEKGVLWPYPWCCPCYRRTVEEMEQTRAAVKYAFERVAELKS